MIPEHWPNRESSSDEHPISTARWCGALTCRVRTVGVPGQERQRHDRDEFLLFAALATSFSDCTSFEFELRAYDVVGDMAYTAGLEHTTASINGQPRSYTLRATQVYRRETASGT